MIVPKNLIKPLVLSAIALGIGNKMHAQIHIANSIEKNTLLHGIEQYNAGLYVQASSSLKQYLSTTFLPTQHNELLESNFEYRQAYFYYVLSNVKGQIYGAEELALNYLDNVADPVYHQRMSFALAQFYFVLNNYDLALKYYEAAGLDNLSNEEISDAKFELAYCYFYKNQLEQSKNLFAAIKDIRNHKYYIPGNYYYGLLAYNDKDYKTALRSFELIENVPEYKDVIPYYQAEIHYFLGNKLKVKELTKAYLADSKNTVYRKEMHLLKAQTNFEDQKYEDALPDFNYYLQNSDKVRKEVFYEIGYTYYKLKKWNDAIATFKELSIAKDSLGQTSMYLLGDCYLKENDKNGAKNAFGLASEMPYNTSISEAATFLYAKLSYELGNEIVATRKFNDYVNLYPNGQSINEAKSLLTNLLLKSSNYEEAFKIISEANLQDNLLKGTYQKVAVGRGLQLLIDNKPTEAAKIFKLSTQYPIHAEFEAIANFWLGEISYQTGAYTEAVTYLNQYIALKSSHNAAQKLSPSTNNANAQLTLGYAKMELGNYDDAHNAFTLAQKQSDYSDVSKIATLRAADAAFMKKDYTTADKLYSQAILSNVEEKEYAVYQRAIIAGLNNNDTEKYKLLQSLTQTSNVTYKEAAIVELSTLDLQDKNYEAAINNLKSTINNTQNRQIKANALYKLAFAYQETEQNDLAIATYKNFIENYPTSSDRSSAIEGLRLLYVAENNFDGYLQYAQSQNLPALDEITRQQSYFDEIENVFEKQDWKSVIEKTSTFVTNFSNSQYYQPSLYYRAEAYRMTQNINDALKDYVKVVESGWNAYSEDATSKMAPIYLDNKDYSNAEKYYKILLENSQYNAHINSATIGLMKTFEQSGDLYNASVYALKIVENTALDKYDIAAANVLLSKIDIQSEKYNDALNKLNKVSTINLGTYSAEAKYLSAWILYKQNRLDEAVKAADKAAKTSSQYQFWVTKNYLLIAEIMLIEKDYFEANAIVEELKKGVKISELTDEINSMYNKVKKAQQENSKIEE
jgi:tetratricopeptide (TPR) repeat protein